MSVATSDHHIYGVIELLTLGELHVYPYDFDGISGFHCLSGVKTLTLRFH